MKQHLSRSPGYLVPLAVSCILPSVSIAAPSASSLYASSTAFQKRWLKDVSQTDQRVTVGRTSHPITIDGNINPREWEDATEISNLIDGNAFDSALYQTHIWMTYDQHYLYVGVQSVFPESAKRVPAQLLSQTLLRSRAIIDGNVDLDDSIGLDIIPRYPQGDLYKLFVNNAGTKYDYVFHKPGNDVDIKWDPQWITKTSVTNSSWNMEVALPIDAFGVKTIKDGETWAVNIARLWRMMRNGTDQWATGGAPDANPKLPFRIWPFGQVRFEGTQSVVIKDQGTSGLMDGHITARLLLKNRMTVPQQLTAQLSLASKVLSTRKINLPAQASQSTALTADLTGSMAGLLDFAVTDESGKVLFKQQLPYKPQTGLNVDIKSYPSSNLMQAAWELRRPQSELKNLSLEIALQDEGKARPAIVRQVAQLQDLKGSADFKTLGLPNGPYLVAVTLKRNGKTIASRNLSYEQKPLPSWIGNQYGISKNPPPPWTPIKESRDQVDIWGRQVQYEGQLFPAQIINKKLPMLARPIQLNVQGMGQKAATSAGRKAAVQWLLKSPTRVTSKRVQHIGNVKVTSTSYIEFDGMTWIDLEVAPDKQNTRLNNLTFSIPLNKDWAQLINAYDSTLRTDGKLPDKGWHGSMRPLWVGNGDGGVQVFEETDAAWRGSKQISVRQDGDAVLLQAHLIDTPTTLGKPLKFAFGFITTPVKPAPANFRDWRVISGYGGNHPAVDAYLKTLAARNSKLAVNDIWNQGWWLPAGYSGNPDWTGFLPVPGTAAAASYLQHTSEGYDVRRSLYGRILLIGTNNPWFRQFGDEWTVSKNLIFDIPPTANDLTAGTEVSSSSASYRDFVAWGYHQLFSQHRVPGLYFDVSDMWEDDNTYHGSGVDTGYGTAIPTQNILGQREIFKRIYTQLKEHYPQAMIFHHMSGHVLMPVDSFVDAQVDGENFNSLLNRNDDSGYEHVLSLDQFRAEYAGQNNFGPVGVFLDELRGNSNGPGDGWINMRNHADYLLGMVLLHNSTNWWSWMPSEYYVEMYSALDDIGVNSSFAFVPYWHQKALALPPGVVASFYVSPQHNKAAMVLLNASDKEQPVDLKVNGQVLGLNDKSLAAKAIYPPTTSVGPDSQQIVLPAYTVRIFEES